MKKKLLIAFIAIIAALCCVFGLTACDSGIGGSVEQGGNTDNTKKYTIIYNANGGMFADGAETVTQTAESGATLTAPNSPVRAAYAFGGWTTDKNGKTLWKFASDTVTGNLTLYAVWEEQAAAIISADGATIDESEMSVFMLVDNKTDSVSLANKIVCSSDSVWKLYYDKLGQTEIPTKIAAGQSGFLSDGDNMFYIVVTSSGGSQVNVYELTVHRSYSVSVNYYDNKNLLIYTDYTYTGYEYNINYKPDITGYTFNYWKKSGSEVTSVTPYSSVSLYADCTAKTYTATLKVNGGDELVKTEYTATYDESFSLSTPTRTGYSFGGWYIDSEQITGANGASLESWTYTTDKTLTANWTVNSYKVTLNRDLSEGGTVTGSGNHDYDSHVTITASTNRDFTWLGWYDKDGGLLTDELSYTFKMGLDVAYTAKWIECPVTFEKSLPAAGTLTYTAETVAGGEYTVTAQTNRGYIWLGWYNGEELLTTEVSYNYTIPSSGENAATYTAKWSINEELSNFGFTSTASTLTITGIKDTTLTEIIVPEYVTDISKAAFNGCSNLERITLPFVGGAIKNSPDTYQYPFGYIFGVSSYTGGIAVKQKHRVSASAITYATYYIPATLKEVTVTGGNIIYGAFYNCTLLTDVTIGNGVMSIDEEAFCECSGLTSITIGNSVTKIGKEAFKGCTSLTDVLIGNGVATIGKAAFEGCTSLESITIPDGVTLFEDYAFKDCTSLESITLPFLGYAPDARDKHIGFLFGAQYYNSNQDCVPASLKTVIVTGGSEIDMGAFYFCTSLESVTIPSSVTEIGRYAFNGCSVLTDIYFNGTTEQWNAISKGDRWDDYTGNYTVHCTDGDISK